LGVVTTATIVSLGKRQTPSQNSAAISDAFLTLRLPFVGKHAKYPQPLAYYARAYNRSYETVKTWVARGKAAGRLPPLESPAEFVHWYQRLIGHLPADLWALCSAGAAAPVAADPPRAAGNGQAVSPPAAPRRDFSDVGGLDMEGNVKALRRTLAINQRLLEEASLAGDEPRFNLRTRMVGELFNKLRLGEQTLTELQKQRGQLIDRDHVEADLSKVVDTLKQMRESMVKGVLAHLGGDVSPELAGRIEQAITREREAEDTIFRNLGQRQQNENNGP
jgi:hypothetical protein